MFLNKAYILLFIPFIMNKLLVSLSSIFFVLLILPFVIAQEDILFTTESSTSIEDLPEDAGITPDSPLWGVDKALENINLALTFTKENKVKKGLIHAQERLLEVKAMIEENKLEHAERAQDEHKQILDKTKVNIASISEENEEDVEKVADFESVLDEQEEELDEIRAKVIIKIEGITLTE